MSNDKKAKKIAAELGATYKEMIESFAPEDFIGHFRSLLRVKTDFQKYNQPGALSAEKIAILERAVDEYVKTYEAEKAEAEKMPISRHEAARVQALFDSFDDEFAAPPVRIEH